VPACSYQAGGFHCPLGRLRRLLGEGDRDPDGRVLRRRARVVHNNHAAGVRGVKRAIPYRTLDDLEGVSTVSRRIRVRIFALAKVHAAELFRCTSLALHSKMLTTFPAVYPLHLTVTVAPLANWVVGVTVALRWSIGGGTVVMSAGAP